MDIDVDTVETVISFQDGQEVQLEDGSVAYLYHQPKGDTGEALAQPVELEDGELAYVYKPLQNAQDASKPGLDSNLMVPVTFSAFPQSANVKGVASRGVQAFHCDIQDCDKVYSTAHHLKVHKRVHTGEKPYKCKWKNCNKFFTTGYALKSHRRVHTGEKPFSCPVTSCKKAFKTSSDLRKHIRTHTGERPFKCPFDGCGKAFTTSDICKVHIRTHTGERPHKCPFPDCGKSFTNYTNYKNHVRIHTGEKPYKCTVKNCGRSFSEYSSLYKHQLVHSGDRPFVCNVCHKTYRQLSTLNNHKKRVHPDCEDFTSHASGESSNFVSISSNKFTSLASKDTSVNSVVLLPDNSMQAGDYVVDQSTSPQFSILPSQTTSTNYQLATTDNPSPLVVALTGDDDECTAKFQFETCSVAGENDDASLIYINKNQTSSILFPDKSSAANPSFSGLSEENSNVWFSNSSEQTKQPEEISVGTIEINGTKFMVHMIADATDSAASDKLNSAISFDGNMSLPSKDSLIKDTINYFATNSNTSSTSNHQTTTLTSSSAQSAVTTSTPQTTNLNSLSKDKDVSSTESPSTSKPVLFPSAKRRITVKLPRKLVATRKGISAKSRTILPNLKS